MNLSVRAGPGRAGLPKFGNPAARAGLALALMLALPAGPASAAWDPAAAVPEWLHPHAELRLRGDFTQDAARPDERRMLLKLRGWAEAALGDGVAATAGVSTRGPGGVSRDVEAGRDPGRWLMLDQAYISLRPGGNPSWQVAAGRMARPIVQQQTLVFDPDWTADGVFGSFAADGGGVERYACAGEFLTAWDDAADGAWLHTVQAGIGGDVTSMLKVSAKAGAYLFDGLDGEPPLYGEAAGNRLRERPDGGAVYASDFREIEGGASVVFDPYFPIAFAGQAVVNVAADDERTGWLGGITIGRAQAINSVEAGWSWREVDRDAVVGALTDDEFAGGGTGVAGHRFHVRYQLLKNWQCGVAWLHGWRRTQDAPERVDRIFIDLAGRW